VSSVIILRRVGPASLRFTVPSDYVHRFDLSPGDTVVWTEEADGSVRLRFVRADDMGKQAVSELQPEAA